MVTTATLYPHQQQAVEKFQSLDAGAIFFEMGTGKTRTALEICSRRGCRRLLVLLPLSVIGSWLDEIEKCGYVITATVIEGTPQQKASLLKKNTRLTLMSYDSLPSLLTEVQAQGFDALILDESSRAKRYQAQRTKAAMKLSKTIPFKMILTGTPIGQSIVDLWSQFYIVDPSILGWSFVNFRHQWCVMGGWRGKQVVGYKNVDQLMEKLVPYTVRATKSECLDLPKKLYVKKSLPCSPEQKALIKKVRAETKASDFGTVAGALTRMQRITSGYDIFADRALASHPKRTMFEECLEEATLPMMVWTRFLADVQMVAVICDAAGLRVRCLTGESSMSVRQEVLAEWHKGDVDVLISTSVGNYGLNLQEGRTIAFWSLEWSWERRIQAEDRCHRIGTAASPTYIDLLCQRSVDMQIYKLLQQKGDFAKYALEHLDTVLDEVEDA